MTWLEILSMAEERIEFLCTGDRYYLASTLTINREIKLLAECMLDGKDYQEERRKRWAKVKGRKVTATKEISPKDLENFMRTQ